MRLAVLALALASCKGSTQDQAAARDPDRARDTGATTTTAPEALAAADAAPADWTATCATTLQGAAKLTPVRRIAAVLEGCQPCGDWKPLLAWNTASTDGGPTTAAIEDAMVACQAYCSADAKRQFTGVLEPSRGKLGQKPWRVLGEVCKDAVSAVPDVRFMSAPYFALDRIARAAAAAPHLAPLLATLELPLPAVSLTGTGYELPVGPVMKPEPGTHHLTVTLAELRIGTLPRAKLGATGVVVEVGAAPYPGEAVELATLSAALAKVAAPQVTLIAPGAMPAARLADVVAAAGSKPL
ncbi:MAG: hypothetical protein H0X17_07295, partial [Deltaproteobacteria bacterium]|nr:hypothetical protein [Deltaproteobacteria bacterium]